MDKKQVLENLMKRKEALIARSISTSKEMQKIIDESKRPACVAHYNANHPEEFFIHRVSPLRA
jgi:hypothetical protein